MRNLFNSMDDKVKINRSRKGVSERDRERAIDKKWVCSCSSCDIVSATRHQMDDLLLKAKRAFPDAARPTKQTIESHHEKTTERKRERGRRGAG